MKLQEKWIWTDEWLRKAMELNLPRTVSVPTISDSVSQQEKCDMLIRGAALCPVRSDVNMPKMASCDTQFHFGVTCGTQPECSNLSEEV
jgi:hypothetical protein